MKINQANYQDKKDKLTMQYWLNLDYEQYLPIIYSINLMILKKIYLDFKDLIICIYIGCIQIKEI